MGANFLESAAQVSSVLASLSIIFAIVAYRREIRGQNLQSLFYMHQYLAKDDFADARRICRTRLHGRPLSEWTDHEREAAAHVCLSYEEAAMLLGGGVLNDAGRDLMMQSAWGRSICDFRELLDEFLAAPFTPTETAAEYFPNFMRLYREASILHR
jgi:hypothetical protein